MAPADDIWLVEIVLDTGQRYQSEDLAGRAAAELELDDMRGRAMVVAVTMIQLATGECVTHPSRNLAAAVPVVELTYRVERELLAEAMGLGRGAGDGASSAA